MLKQGRSKAAPLSLALDLHMKKLLPFILFWASINVSALTIETTKVERDEIYKSGRIGRRASLSNGDTKGWFCRSVVEGGIFSKIGLQKGDLIVGVNKQYFPDLEMTKFVNIIRKANSFEIHIKKKSTGETVDIPVQFLFEEDKSNKTIKNRP